MATVGGVTCDICAGLVQRPRAEIETWTVAGIDGHAARNLGRRGTWQFTVSRFADWTTLELWMDSIEALQGTVIQITDDFGKVYSGLLVNKVEISERKALIGTNIEAVVRYRLEGTVGT